MGAVSAEQKMLEHSPSVEPTSFAEVPQSTPIKFKPPETMTHTAAIASAKSVGYLAELPAPQNGGKNDYSPETEALPEAAFVTAPSKQEETSAGSTTSATKRKLVESEDPVSLPTKRTRRQQIYCLRTDFKAMRVNVQKS